MVRHNRETERIGIEQLYASLSNHFFGKKMKRFAIAAAIITISNAVAADPAPILVVREMDPWRMVIGSDSAKFAIYRFA